MDRGDIWSIEFDPSAGSEIYNRRPALIVTKRDFNTATGMAIVCPITDGGNLARVKGFAVTLSGAGTKTDGVILCHQVKSLDTRSRGAKKIERAPDFIVREVLNCLADLFE